MELYYQISVGTLSRPIDMELSEFLMHDSR